MRPGGILHAFGANIATHRLWSRGDRVAAAVSGGLDSVVLLDLLVATQRWHGGVLSVVTVDHGTRVDSAADAQFVEEMAAARGLPCLRHTAALGPAASEDACRSVRYGWFDRLDVDRVILGHHADDQAETILIQLLRGTGLRGMAGMAWRRDRYVRPLLDVTRIAIAAWALHRGLRWREDASNSDPRFLRNRIRHQVLPLLDEVRPGARGAIARTATRVAADMACLAKLRIPNDFGEQLQMDREKTEKGS